MTTVYRSGEARSFRILFRDGEGASVVPVRASYTIFDDSGVSIQNSKAVDLGKSSESVVVRISSDRNTIDIGSIRGFRTLVLTFEDSIGNCYEQKVAYILEAGSVMELGTNTFAKYENFVLLLKEMPELSAAMLATPGEFKSALINAYYNIGNLIVDFGAHLPDVYTTLDIGSGDLIALESTVLTRLRLATLIEADAILRGEAAIFHRRMGLMSRSAPVSSTPLRLSRGLDRLVSQGAANMLTPYIKR